MPTVKVINEIQKFNKFISIKNIEIVIQKTVKPVTIIFWLFKSFIFKKKRNMEVISIKIPEIINHKIIEILEVLPPTKVSSNASLTKYKIIPLYKA